jgi:hypothetical protein
MSIIADIFQTGTHETEWFVFGTVFDLKDLLDGFLVENITAYPVHCISRIADNRPTAKLLGYLLNMALLRIIRINGNNHIS